MNSMAQCRLLCVLLLAVLTGCAGIDKGVMTRLEPVPSADGRKAFRFVAIADTAYPVDSESAERTRKAWLEEAMRGNGYPPGSYSILSRTPLLRSKTLFGGMYDIYYDIQIK